jgi:DNA polymerase III alpha subunit
MRRRSMGSSQSSGANSTSARKTDHRAKPDPDLKYNHLVVLAENEEGYRNLVRLTSEAALHGFYRKPRVSKDTSPNTRRA